VFLVVSNIFSLIFNKVLIFLYSFLYSIHINYPVATCEIFNFLSKEVVDYIIFVIHMLGLSNILCRCFFIILYIFLKYYPTH
jgi:hypothetical protein